MLRVFALHTDEIKKLPPAYAREHFPLRAQQSARYYFEADQLLSIGAGALLYACLGLEETSIAAGEYGKLYDTTGSVFFNLSHSGEYVILAAGESEIGTDIERCSEKNLVAAKRVYTSEEIAWMEQAPVARFTHLWTLKESVMKAVGKGFRLEPRSFCALPMIAGEPIEIDGVKLYSFTNSFHDYMVSVCSEKPIKSFVIKELTAEEILKKG